MNKTTIRNDPFASVIPVSMETTTAATIAERETATPASNTSDRRIEKVAVHPIPPRAGNNEKPRRQKLTIHLDEDLVGRVKNAAYWNPRLTIAKIAERGMRLAIEEVEKENGGRYMQRESELVGGRPIK